MAVDGAGIVYACDWHRDEVVRVDPSTGAWSTYTAGAPELPIDDPNSPVFAEDGTMYVTGSENPAIFRVAPGGATEVWSRAAPGYPNGVTLTPEGDAFDRRGVAPRGPRRRRASGGSRSRPTAARARRR